MSACSTKPPGPARYGGLLFRGGIEEQRILPVGGVRSDFVAAGGAALRRAIPGFDRYRAAGQIELLAGTEWYLRGNEFDLQRITSGWNEKLSAALATGYDGVRASGSAFWLRTKHWKAFCDHEYELD